MNESILDELNRNREEEAAAFNYDLRALFEHYKTVAAESGRPHVSFPPQPVRDRGNVEALCAETSPSAKHRTT